ncbi:GAF domain-containing protein [Bergeriella denitrificans]|uniref:Uncharacterized protein n=1 Tax=Bergeriella denitrificans TaxID=494 RepID=A0A378UGN0_BERDE|nr:GAF domain-containing protein [Bergeriella denitrificans]STZ75612.1 Uncharacterised protein [Bergeriella denitrificans]
MPASLIRDYLQTQGLKLPQDDVRIAYAAAQAVMDLGRASVDRSVLWYACDGVALADYLPQTEENEALLKQVFMALDSVYSRQAHIRSAVVYAHLPAEETGAQLVCLSRQGELIEHCLSVDEAAGQSHLPCRTAQSGWLNICNDSAHWLAIGELAGEHNLRSGAQFTAPVCTAGGAVLGVVHVEFDDKDRADEAAQAEWTALALALAAPLQKLLRVEDIDGEE